MTNKNNRMALQVGRVKAMSENGYTNKEISETLGISESTVRSYKDTIDRAEKNKSAMKGS